MTNRMVKNNTVLAVAALCLSGCVTVQNEDIPLVDAERVFTLSKEADQAYIESRWIDAARRYQQLAVMVPKDAYAWFRLGNTYSQQGSYQQAIEAYQSAIERNPALPKPWYNLATAHLLNAERALMASYDRLRPGDPARKLIENQLKSLNALIYQKVEDALPPNNGLALR